MSGSTWLARWIESGPKQARSMVSPYTQRTTPWGSITSCMVASATRRTRTNELPAWPIHQHALHLSLNPAHLGGNVLPQGTVVAQILGGHAAHQPLGFCDQRIQFGIGTDVEVPEALEELSEVGDGGIAKDPTLATFVIGQALGQA